MLIKRTLAMLLIAVASAFGYAQTSPPLDQPVSPELARAQDIIDAVVAQRNEAMNRAAAMQADIVKLQKELAQATAAKSKCNESVN